MGAQKVPENNKKLSGHIGILLRGQKSTPQKTKKYLKSIKQARKLQATLVRNYDRLTDSLTGVKCRATSVAKNQSTLIFDNDVSNQISQGDNNMIN